jgi:mono/diheme cytochrome c family protein
MLPRVPPYPCCAPLIALLLVACGAPAPAGWSASATSGGSAQTTLASRSAGSAELEQVLRGRQLVISHGCGDCHGGSANPAAEGWLAGRSGLNGVMSIGDYRVWPANLTTDAETGLARYTDRQVFNALRYGLRPASTRDVEITSATPGSGNHPGEPDYLAPSMPWLAFRHLPDREILEIIAYLRHLEPVRNAVPDGVRPADRWAGAFAAKMGSRPPPPFPTANEELHDPARREQVLQGRQLVLSMACGDCHGGSDNPAAGGWLRGVLPVEQRVHPGPFEKEFQIGPFKTYGRNLTPDNMTGLGRFSERQIFNALRYGLRPGQTADVEITSAVAGEGNHPVHPKYLAPPMPWPAWRHLRDEELWAIIAYLKQGLKPVRNLVVESGGPPDFWVGTYTPDAFGTYPSPAFPTVNERAP